MKRRVFQALGIGFVAVIGAAILSWPTILAYLAGSGLRTVREQGVQLSWAGLESSWNGVSLESLTTTLPGPKIPEGAGIFSGGNIPIPIEVHKPSARLRPSSILTLNPQLIFSASLYGGNAIGDASSLFGDPYIRGIISEVRLDQHPLIAATGVQGAVLTAKSDGIIVPRSGALPQGKVTFELTEISPPPSPMLRTLTKVENVGPIDAGGHALLSGDTVTFKELSISCPFLALKGESTIRDVSSRSPSLTGNFLVTLSRAGIDAFGNWLAVLTDGVIPNNSGSFRLQISTKSCPLLAPGKRRISFGTQCLDITFVA